MEGQLRWRCRHVVIELFILLTLFGGVFGQDTNCTDLTVFKNGIKVITSIVCLRKFRTPDCQKFAMTFDVNNLPPNFPKEQVPVGKPAEINLIDIDYPFGDIVYHGISVRWKSPSMGAGRQNCYGYLVKWYPRDNISSVYCQLFQLNTKSPVLMDELTYHYQIEKVTSGIVYVVEVHSLPLSITGEAAIMRIMVPPIRQLSKYGEEPATWVPALTYQFVGATSVIVKYSLPPAQLGISKMNMYLVNTDNMQHPLYDIHFDVQPYSESTPQGVQVFQVNSSGIYKVVLWVRENKFPPDKDNCVCWKYGFNKKKECDICGSIAFGFNVTATGMPELPDRKANATLEFILVEDGTWRLAIFAVVLFAFMITVVFSFVITIAQAKKRSAEEKKKEQEEFPDIASNESTVSAIVTPEDVNDVNDNHCACEIDDLRTFSDVKPLSKKIVYVLYADDHKPHLQLINSFIKFLEVHCYCKTITPSCCECDGPGVYKWFICNINMSDHIIFVNSEGAEKLTLAYLKNRNYSARKPTLEGELFRYGLQYLMVNQEAREGKLSLVSFQGNHCQKYLHTPMIYILPEHLKLFLCNMHSLNGKVAKMYEKCLPMQAQNISNLNEGLALLSSLQAVKHFEKNSPDWFDRHFGTLKSMSEDSGCISYSTGSVSSEDTTHIETDRSSAVFEQPDFTHGFHSKNQPDGSKDRKNSKFLANMDMYAVNGIILSDSKLQEANIYIKQDNLGDKLSCLTVLSFNEIPNVDEKDNMKQQMETNDMLSIIPPESISEIILEGQNLASAEAMRNEESTPQLPLINCDITSFHELSDEKFVPGLHLNSPDVVTNTQLDSVRSDFQAVTAESIPQSLLINCDIASCRELSDEKFVPGLHLNSPDAVTNTQLDSVRSDFQSVTAESIPQSLLINCDIASCHELSDKKFVPVLHLNSPDAVTNAQLDSSVSDFQASTATRNSP